MEASSSYAYEQAVFKGLTDDVYSACRFYDFNKLRTPNYEKTFVNGLKKMIGGVFDKYINDKGNGLSEANRRNLEGVRQMTVNYIPSFVTTRKGELNIKERRKPPSKLRKFFGEPMNRGAVIGALIGASIPALAEGYSAITGDQTLREIMYDPEYPKWGLLLGHEVGGFAIGMMGGLFSDIGLTYISRKKRVKKQYKPLINNLKERLQS